MSKILAWSILAFILVAVPRIGIAQEATQSASPAPEAGEGPAIGQVTNLPLPRFASLKASKANARRGPSTSHRIDWVFLRSGVPLEIIAEFGNWRRVRTVDDAGGWVHSGLLTGKRTVIVTVDETPIHILPDADASAVAMVNSMVIANIEECERDWCLVQIMDHRGWVSKDRVWGVYVEEQF